MLRNNLETSRLQATSFPEDLLPCGSSLRLPFPPEARGWQSLEPAIGR